MYGAGYDQETVSYYTAALTSMVMAGRDNLSMQLNRRRTDKVPGKPSGWAKVQVAKSELQHALANAVYLGLLWTNEKDVAEELQKWKENADAQVGRESGGDANQDGAASRRPACAPPIRNEEGSAKAGD